MKKQINMMAFLLLSSFLGGTANAQAAKPTDHLPLLPETNVSLSAARQSVGQNFLASDEELVRDFCPPIESLVRDPKSQKWYAPGGWKTISPSFLRTVDTFVGAQWVGISIGEVICVYTKASRSSFPVMLQRGKLVPAPLVGGIWSSDKGGYMECKSNDVRNCPFFTQLPKKQRNVYEQLDFYKGKPTESSD